MTVREGGRLVKDGNELAVHSPNKEELEKLKLQLEISVLSRPWWQQATIYAAVLPSLLAILALIWAIGSGRLQIQAHELEARRQNLILDINRFTEEKRRIEKTNEELSDERDRLVSANKLLINERQNLEDATQRLGAEARRLSSRNKALAQNNQQLTQRNVKLDRDLESSRLDQQQLASQNETLVANIELLRSPVIVSTDLSSHRVDIVGLNFGDSAGVIALRVTYDTQRWVFARESSSTTTVYEGNIKAVVWKDRFITFDLPSEVDLAAYPDRFWETPDGKSEQYRSLTLTVTITTASGRSAPATLVR